MTKAQTKPAPQHEISSLLIKLYAIKVEQDKKIKRYALHGNHFIKPIK